VIRKILEKRGEVDYQLEFLPQLSDVHDVFHVSQLKKCLRVPEEQISLEDLDTKEDLSYQVYPVKILETSNRVTRKKRIKMCKVQWSHHTKEEATWEREEELKAEFLSFFFDLDAKEDLSYQEYPVKILETSDRFTRKKRIKMCKVQWSHYTEDETTWEREEELKAEFPSFFFDPSESRG
jgi:hypothetical protein